MERSSRATTRVAPTMPRGKRLSRPVHSRGGPRGRPAGGWESPLNRIRQQSPQAAKHGVCNSPDSLSGNAIGITGIHNHGYILPEREKKDKGAESRAEEKEKKGKLLGGYARQKAGELG